MAGTKLDNRQVVNRSALSMIGSAANDTLDTIFPKIDAELAKLFEDRNITLVDGGIITFPAAGTSVTFTTNLKLHINSQVAGGSPTVIDLAATTRTLSANLKMVYAVINRSAGTATVTDDSSTLPAQTSANQEIVLIAKRVDSGDGTKRVYFRGGFSLSAGQSSRFGTSGILFSNEFAVVDATDTTKKVLIQVSGSATGTQTTLAFAQTVNRVLTFPDITDTLVSRTNTETLSNKQVQYSSSTDSTTTGGNATAQSFTTGIIRLTNSSLTSLSGIPAGSSGQFVIVENKTGNQITINNEEATATANNRIQTGTSSNISMPNNATFMFTYDSTSSRWQLSGGSGSGSGSGGSKNYLSAITTSRSTTPNTGNGNFELGSTTGWSLFNTTLTSGKPTGSITAGAASVTTFNTVSSNQLAGSYSLQTASSGAWSAGQGFISNAFYTDNEDETAVMSFKFYYQVISGLANLNLSGTSSNTFAVYLYDVTNSAWLEPSGTYSMVQGSGVGLAVGTFQGVKNTTQYRLAVICVNASAGATTLYWDDFSVGPDSVSRGAAITDWQSYSPSGFSSTNATVSGKWRRVGDSMEVNWSAEWSGAAGAFSGSPTIPSGYAIDSTKLPGTSGSTQDRIAIGTGAILDSGVALYPLFVTYKDTTTVNFWREITQSGTNPVAVQNATVSNTTPMSFGANDIITLQFKVPILGWSSSVQMSDSADTRVVSFTGTQSSQAVTANVTNITFTPTKDSHGMWSTNQYTVPVPGDYVVNGGYIATTAAAAFDVYLNGVHYGYMGAVYTSGAVGGGSVSLSNLKSGDIITVRSTQTTTISSANLGISRISGPSVIAASETVACLYKPSSAPTGTLSNSLNLVTYNTKIKDSHGSYNSGIFTVPISGQYDVKAQINTLITTAVAGQYHGLAIFIDGSEYFSTFTKIASSSVTEAYPTVSLDNIPLKAGQTIAIYSYMDGTGVTYNTHSVHHALSIKRSGNY